ncbi:MAG: hypothetical protein IH991_11595 [Planctomycetes bacterium]|nr:hypothetical protein [Planctomycetota bacterium]
MKELRWMALLSIGIFAVGCGGGDADGPAADGSPVNSANVVKISVPTMA